MIFDMAKGGNMQINNNVSFSGLKIKGITKTNDLDELNKFITDKRNLIKVLDEKYETDVFLSEDRANVTFHHHKYREGIMDRVGGQMEPIPVSEFIESNAAKIFEAVETSIEKTRNAWRKMDILAMLT